MVKLLDCLFSINSLQNFLNVNCNNIDAIEADSKILFLVSEALYDQEDNCEIFYILKCG